MPNLRDLLAPSRLTAIVDIGANPIDDKPPYSRMLEEGLCTVVGVDPQQNGTPATGVTYLPLVVGTGKPATLHICEAPGMTSLLPPDTRRIKSLPGFEQWATVIERRSVETVRLDDIPDIPHSDMICLDVQGSELDVLMWGRKRLRSAVAVIAEVSFVPLYRGQPTIGDVDTHLRAAGFIPHCFAGAKVWPIQTNTQPPRHDPHQILEADIVYVRDYMAGMLLADQWRHLAMLAHYVFGSFDLAMRCVEALAEMEQVAPSAPMQYRQMLEAL